MTSCIQEIRIPRETVNDEFATVVGIRYANGDKVSAGDELLDLETSKTLFSVTADCDGYVEYLCKSDQDIAIGSTVVRIHSEPSAAMQCSTGLKSAGLLPETRFSSRALQRITELGIDRSIFADRDLVTIHDVHDRGAVNTDSFDVTFEKLTRAKHTEINRLSEVQSAALTGSITVSVDMHGVFASLNRNMHFFQDSLLPLIVYESSRLLRQYQRLNARMEDDRIALHNHVHIGVAMDIDDGLKVARIPDADRLTFPQIEAEIHHLAEKYLDRTLDESDLFGATFTITDLSAEGVHSFVPLIDAGQSAILAISGVDPTTARCLLTLTFDHRVTEGKTAARFLGELKTRIESQCLSSAEHVKPLDTPCCSRCLKTLTEDRDSKGPGLIKVLSHNNEEIYLCRPCFDGW